MHREFRGRSDGESKSKGSPVVFRHSGALKIDGVRVTDFSRAPGISRIFDPLPAAGGMSGARFASLSAS